MAVSVPSFNCHITPSLPTMSFRCVWYPFIIVKRSSSYYRQDKLVLLLDTGTSPAVRRTASKQLADLTFKIFTAARPTDRKAAPLRDDQPPGSSSDGQVDVKPDVSESVSLHASLSEDEAWDEVLETISKLIPLLKSRQSESRSAAAHALGLIADYLPPYVGTGTTSAEIPFDTPPVDLVDVLRTGGTLLASAGREYIAKPAPGDKAKRRQAMKGALGFGDAVGWGDDVDKVIGDEDEDVDMSGNGSKKQSELGTATPPTLDPPRDIFEGLSARQVIMIKRKKGNMEEEANKSVRTSSKVGNRADQTG